VVVEPLAGGDPGQIAGYRVQARLGFGSAGPVYLAAAPDGRPVAITVVRPEFVADQAFRERLAERLGVARAIQSPHLVPLLDADLPGPQPWFATAYVQGPSLQQAIAQYGPMPTGTALMLASAVAQALAAAHAAGISHGDLRPSGVLLAQSGPQVTGLGLAGAVQAAELGREALRAGSVRYQAPEQILGGPAVAESAAESATDSAAETISISMSVPMSIPAPAPASTATPIAAPADVFALGHLAAYALLGRSPFGTGDQVAVSHRILHQDPDLAGCPEFLCELIERTLAKDPAARPTAAEVAEFCGAHTPAQAPLWPAPIPVPIPPSATALAQGGAPGGRRPRWPWSRAMSIAAAATVLVIAAAAVTTALLLQGSNTAAAAPPPHPSPVAHVSASASPSPSPSPSPAIDPCLVGSWKGVSDNVNNTIDSNTVTFTGPGPASTVFTADGTNTSNFGSGEVLTATVDGDHWTETLKGTSTQHVETRDGTMLSSNVVTKGTFVLKDANGSNTTGALALNTAPAPYSCSGNTLREYDDQGGSTVFTRVGP